MLASERITELEGALASAHARVGLLEAQLAAQGVEAISDVPEWAAGLAPGPLAVLMALVQAYPRAVSAPVLEEIIPKRDHVTERDLKIVDAHVWRIRKALGRDVIENVWGRGWRCSKAFHQLATQAVE